MKLTQFSISCVLAVAVLLGACNQKSKVEDNRVWNDVAIGYNNTFDVIKVTNVKLLDEYTEVRVHITFPANYWIRIASNIYLQAGDKQKLRVTKVMEK